MSISTLQEKLLNKGCGSAVIVVAALLMGVSIFTGQCSNGTSSQQNQAAQQSAVVTVGGIPISGDMIQSLSEKNLQSIGQQGVLAQSYSLAGATGQLVNTAAIEALIRQGSEVTEAEVERASKAFLEGILEKARGQLEGEKKLKPGANEAEFEKALKPQLGGKTLAQFKSNFLDERKKAFNDPKTKGGVLEILGNFILGNRLAEKEVGDDRALRNGYKTYFLKRIFFSTASGSKETPEARGAKALAALKAGTSFDTLMDTVSNDPPRAGGRVHDSTDPVPATAIDQRPEFAELKDKAALATTSLVDVPGGKAIYQIASIQDSTPSDFDTNKQKYRDQRIAELGKSLAEGKISQFLASDEVKWNVVGFRALNEAQIAVTANSPDAFKKALADAQTIAKSGDAVSKKLAARAMLVLTDPDSLLSRLNPQAAADEATAYELAQTEGLADAAMTFKLAKIYGDKKDGAKAADALLQASKNNMRFDTTAQVLFRDINALALKLQGTKVITAAQLEAVQSQQALWSSAFAENAKAEAEAKKLNDAEIARQKAEAAKTSAVDAATKKANDAEIARQKAEAAATQKAGATKPGAATGTGATSTTPPPVTPPATTGKP